MQAYYSVTRPFPPCERGGNARLVGTLTWYQPRLQLVSKCCVYIACCCYSPCVHKQVPGCTVAIVTLLACSCKLYIVVSQIVAQLLNLKCMHVLVQTSIHVACYSHRGISTYVLLFQVARRSVVQADFSSACQERATTAFKLGEQVTP